METSLLRAARQALSKASFDAFNDLSASSLCALQHSCLSEQGLRLGLYIYFGVSAAPLSVPAGVGQSLSKVTL